MNHLWILGKAGCSPTLYSHFEYIWGCLDKTNNNLKLWTFRSRCGRNVGTWKWPSSKIRYSCESIISELQSVSIAQSRGLLKSFYLSSSGIFLLVWLYSSCSMAHRPGEHPQKLSSKPSDRAIDTLCSTIQSSIFRHMLGGHNLLTMTFPSAFAASAAAIFIERPARRALLAVYVANEATQASLDSIICCKNIYI